MPKPVVGDVLLWESWLRHEVPMNMSEEDRISVSFKLRLGLTTLGRCSFARRLLLFHGRLLSLVSLLPH